MGFNSAFFINNDIVHLLDDKDVAIKWVQDIKRAAGSLDVGTPIRIGNSSGFCHLFHCEHANFSGVYIVGQNQTFRLGSTFDYKKHDESNDDYAIRVIKELADNFGYSLRKKKEINP